MNFDKWTPHAHYMGLLMTNPRGKSNLQKYNDAVESKAKARASYDACVNKETVTAGNFLSKVVSYGREVSRLELIKDIPKLSDTCKNKLHEIYTMETTGRKKIIQSKYLEKGLMVEEDAITIYSLYSGQFHKKNEVVGLNEWATGTMDFEWDDMVLDTKSSWDIWTFDKSRLSPINPLYLWQLLTYIWLYNKKKARLVYCLINTPEHLVRAEETKLMYQLFGNEQNYKMAPEYMIEAFEEAKAELRKNHNFDDLPLSRKVKTFDVERDEEKIELMKKRIEECRWYLNNIETIQDENESESD